MNSLTNAAFKPEINQRILDLSDSQPFVSIRRQADIHPDASKLMEYYNRMSFDISTLNRAFEIYNMRNEIPTDASKYVQGDNIIQINLYLIMIDNYKNEQRRTAV